MRNLDVNLRLPAFFSTTLVVEAYDGSLDYRSVLRRLKSIGAIETGDTRPMHVDPQILRDEIPSIYHRCVELIMERRMKGEKNAERKKRHPRRAKK